MVTSSVHYHDYSVTNYEHVDYLVKPTVEFPNP